MPKTTAKPSALADKAIAFCAAKFESGQPLGEAGLCCVPDRTELTRILQEEGGEPDPYLTLAAILRDTLQHADTHEDEILKVFGSEVAAIVAELTESDKFTVTTRKALRLQRATTMSRKAKLILFAEIIETVRQIGGKAAPKSWSVRHKQEYFDWAEKMAAAFGKLNTTLLAVFSAELESARLSLASRVAAKSAR